MLGATLSELCSPTFQGRQGALPVHGNAFQPQDKGPGCGGQLGGDSDLRHQPRPRCARPGAPTRPTPTPCPAPPLALSGVLSWFLLFSTLSALPLHFSPPPFLCVSVSSTPSVLRFSSLPLGLSASYSVSSLICVSDSNRCGPFSLCPRDLQWYPSLSVSDCLFFRRGSPETSLVVVGWGRGRTHTASASISHCFCYLLETQPLSCPLPGRRESS